MSKGEHACPKFPRRTALGILIALVLAAYGPSLLGGFLWDDAAYLTHNPAVQDPRGLARIWLEADSCPYYHPVLFSVFWLEDRLWDSRPFPCRAVNLALHVLNAGLVVRILRPLLGEASWGAGFLYALHPVQVATVAWITELKNVLSGTFALLTAWLWTSRTPQNQLRNISLGLICFVAGLLTKPMICTLPAALVLWVWWRDSVEAGPRGERAPSLLAALWGTRLSLLPFWGASLIAALLMIRHVQNPQGMVDANFDFTLLERWVLAGQIASHYAWDLIWPVRLTPVYGKWDVNAASPWPHLFPLAWVGLVALCWGLRRRLGTGPLVAILYYLLMLSPVLGILDYGGMAYCFVFDHHQYHAVIGPAALLAGILLGTDWLGPRLGARLRRAMLLAVILVLTVLSNRTSHLYADELDLWQYTVRTVPRSAKAAGFLAAKLMEKGRAEEALQVTERALADNPGDAEAHFALAGVLAHLGRNAEALQSLQEAVRLNPSFATARFNLALGLIREGQARQAAEQLRELLRRRPGCREAYVPLADALILIGESDEAERVLRAALELDPPSTEARDRLDRLNRSGIPSPSR